MSAAGECDGRSRRVVWVRQVLLGMLVFGVTGSWVHHHAGDPDLGELTRKLHFFAAHKDDYDLVFVGSSRVKRGIVPELLDAKLADRGISIRSFNFGVAGMEPHLARVVVRRILALEPARLRWMVVELGDWDPEIRPASRFKRRTIFWHDFAETRAVLRATLHADLPIAARADRAAVHVLHFAARAMGAGRGGDLVRRFRVGATPAEPMPGQGFVPFDPRWLGSKTRHPMRRKFLRELPEYRHAVARMSSSEAVSGRRDSATSSFDVAALQAQMTMIRRAGVEPLALITPIPRATPELAQLGQTGLVPGLLKYNDPQAYPGLYAEAHRFDYEHLTETGALILTEHVARHLATWIGARADTAVAGLGR